MNPLQAYISDLDISRFLFRVASSPKNFDIQTPGLFRTYIDYLNEKKMKKHVQSLNSLKEWLYNQDRNSYEIIKKAMERAIITEMSLSVRKFISNDEMHKDILSDAYIKDHADVVLRYLVWLHKLAEIISRNSLNSDSDYIMKVFNYAPLDHIGELSAVITNTKNSWNLGVTFTVATDSDLQEKIIIVGFTTDMEPIFEHILKTNRFLSEQTTLKLVRIQHRYVRSNLYSGISTVSSNSHLFTKVEAIKYIQNTETMFYILKNPPEKSF
ncbi:MAG: hypothetical protein NZ908_02470 [Candidatus Micrarchaeota archaeon]|nr:hypothetical protein [Candidatus Micrarchaeota archaeon]MCX8154301.1 hypothetical protein [Candidatus Micrarchaeota archaeon]